jgi:hypothetical protein
MIDFNKIPTADLNDIKRFVNKNIHKSEFEKYYLFTINDREKASLFLIAVRMLTSVNNFIKEGEIKKEFSKQINKIKIIEKEVKNVLFELGFGFHYERDDLEEKLMILMNKNDVNEVIDIFSVLLESTNILQISKIGGFILEGESGKEFKKIMNSENEEDLIAAPEIEIPENFTENDMPDKLLEQEIKQPEESA